MRKTCFLRLKPCVILVFIKVNPANYISSKWSTKINSTTDSFCVLTSVRLHSCCLCLSRLLPVRCNTICTALYNKTTQLLPGNQQYCSSYLITRNAVMFAEIAPTKWSSQLLTMMQRTDGEKTFLLASWVLVSTSETLNTMNCISINPPLDDWSVGTYFFTAFHLHKQLPLTLQTMQATITVA